MERRKVNPDWIRPNLQEEKENGEIARVIVEFLKKEPTTENITIIIGALESAPVLDLSDEEWELLENTDSLISVRVGHIEDVEKYVEKRNSKLPPEDRHDFKKILNGFQNGSKMQMPAILRDASGRTHLVSGNTRLMICRALNVRPKVIIGKLE